MWWGKGSGLGGYIAPAAWGVPAALEHGARSQVAHKWAGWLHNPYTMGAPTALERGVSHKWAGWLHNHRRVGVPNTSKRGEGSEVAHKWAGWLHNPCRLGGNHCIRAEGKIRSVPQVGWVAT